MSRSERQRHACSPTASPITCSMQQRIWSNCMPMAAATACCAWQTCVRTTSLNPSPTRKGCQRSALTVEPTQSSLPPCSRACLGQNAWSSSGLGMRLAWRRTELVAQSSPHSSALWSRPLRIARAYPRALVAFSAHCARVPLVNSWRASLAARGIVWTSLCHR